MTSEQNKSIEKFREKPGYVCAYFLFTTILFFYIKDLLRESEIIIK